MAIKRWNGPIIIDKETAKEMAKKEPCSEYQKRCADFVSKFPSPILHRSALMSSIEKEIDKFEKECCNECDPYNIAYGEGIVKGLYIALGIVEKGKL